MVSDFCATFPEIITYMQENVHRWEKKFALPRMHDVEIVYEDQENLQRSQSKAGPERQTIQDLPLDHDERLLLIEPDLSAGDERLAREDQRPDRPEVEGEQEELQAGEEHRAGQEHGDNQRSVHVHGGHVVRVAPAVPEAGQPRGLHEQPQPARGLRQDGHRRGHLQVQDRSRIRSPVHRRE